MTEPRYTMEFGEMSGYDGMTGAWLILDTTTGNYAVTIDQAEFGQEHCAYDFRSAEAERVAKICLEALNQDHAQENYYDG